MSGGRILLSRCSFMVIRNVKSECIRGCSSVPGIQSKVQKCDPTYQPVSEFYAGKSVFITGGTGFLGKVFIEKLLYSCSKLDKIYLLVRGKKGVDANDRIKVLFENPLFARLKESNPQFIKKIVPITGDLTSPNLGLKPEDEQALIDKVSVVFHAAATVRFTEPLPVTMRINFEGTRLILKLCQRMKNLEAFVYVSTAYTHTETKVLAETVYPAPAEIDDVYKFTQRYGYDQRDDAQFLGDQPNTYTFTKALCETYIAKNRGSVPTIIVRPSIVTPILDGPVKGWIDNWLGATSFLFNIAKGWNRFVLGAGDGTVDLIPVDYVSNLTIVAAAKAGKSKDVKVFNSTSSAENPVSWAEICTYFNEEMVRSGKNELPYPKVLFTNSKAVLNTGTLLCQIAPAYIADLWLKMTGREAKYVKIVSQVMYSRNVHDYFTSHFWVMKADRTRELFSSMSPEDREQFPCDPTQIVWREYMKDYCKGVFQYLKHRTAA